MLFPNGKKETPNIPWGGKFGPRVINVPGASRTHKGVDFTGYGIVRAISAGTVTDVGRPAGWYGGGIQVWIQHGGYFTRSMHLASAMVHVGQKVNEGDALGVMGMTGVAGGIHHHLEVTLGQVHHSNTGQINPVTFIKERLHESAGGNTAGPKPSPLIEEDEEMYSIKINGNQYGVAKQFITHYGDERQAKITRQVTSAKDELHDLGSGNASSEPGKKFASLLDGLGIPRSVLDSAGRVLNPQSRKHEANGTWSREREILAALDKI